MNADLKLLEATADDILAAYQDRPGLWEELEEAGLTRIGIPEEAGGSGGDAEMAAVVLRAAAYHAAEIPIAETLWLAGPLLAAAGLPLPDGQLTAAEAGPAGVTLKPDGSGWRLDGTLERVPWARGAARIVVVVDGRVCVVDPAGATLTEHSNLAGEPRDDVSFTSVALTADQVAELPDGLSLRLRGALARTVQLGGAAQRAMEHSLRYASERRQFGRPLAKFQAMQQYLARIAGEVAILELGARSAVAALDDGGADSTMAIASARTNACRAAGVVTELAHQVHGAIGTTHEHDLRRSTMRLWSWREEFGNESLWASAVGLLAAAAEDPWHLITGTSPARS
ncbi:acyl-CoA dehydrogenase family protein [Streptomyces sp. NPDC102451]|uniref:acyl-CoA dehydrogenase family protein n=1 Tax=Streptomyces sp. NPDC102451 TaxID=3366177 RepID=UPI00380A43FA